MKENSLHLHNVFFELLDNSPEKIRQLIDDCHGYLKPIDGILSFAAGTRAEDCAREVNDRAFDVALTVVFTGREAHDAYQTCEAHDIFVGRNKANWKRARVFDSDVAG